ncbi:phage holin family protein [Rheinheimera salexigens]|uniref:Holin n=1 Tax=Rheinheimera salexigens TaxID=1628148 RepID=A0A1E7Q8F3_9GAMM|nr:hypothetical protein [Rheinheimera salexigens]OEY70343.1 hypothetical protein BI198_12750 [Rheinheimera salexigens]
MNNLVMKPTMEKQTTIAAYFSAISTAFGGLLSLPNLALMLGVIVTVGLGFIQWQVWSNRKRHDAEQHEWARLQHELRLKQLLASENLRQEFDAGDPADPR